MHFQSLTNYIFYFYYSARFSNILAKIALFFMLKSEYQFIFNNGHLHFVSSCKYIVLNYVPSHNITGNTGVSSELMSAVKTGIQTV